MDEAVEKRRKKKRQYLWWEPKPPDPELERALAERRAMLAKGLPEPAAPLPKPKPKKPKPKRKVPPVTARRKGLRFVPCHGGWWVVGPTYDFRKELAAINATWVPDKKRWFIPDWLFDKAYSRLLGDR
jgi:hypothetical protein